MLRKEKSAIIDFLTDEFKSSNGLVICGFTKLTHRQLEGLREYANENDRNLILLKTILQYGLKIKYLLVELLKNL